MHRFIALCLAVTVVVALPSHLSPDNAKPSPTGELNLSLAPEHRWRHLVKEAIHRHGFNFTFAPLLGVINHALPAIEPLAEFFESILAVRFPVYYQELLGIVQTLHDLGYDEQNYGVSVRAFSAWNWLSEINNINISSTSFSSSAAVERLQTVLNKKACTSLITRRKEDGTILHARNDDASAHHYTTNLTVDIDIVEYSNGTSQPIVVAKSTQFLGWVGMYTSLRPGVASLTEDQRARFGPNAKLSMAAYVNLINSNPGAGPSDLIMRQAMVDNGGGIPTSPNFVAPPKNRTFATILSYLQSAPLGEPAYLILAGVDHHDHNVTKALPAQLTYQGAIIARNFTESADTVVNRTLLLGQTTQWVPFDWALIETNWNFWQKLPYRHFDPRRDVLVEHFEKEGRAKITTVDGMLGSLSIPSNTTYSNGVLNVATIFSVILIPQNATLRSYLRHGTGCCA